MSREGVVVHAELIVKHASEQAKRAWLVVLPLYISALALAVIAVALLLRR